MIKILTDSLADLPAELVNQFHIHVIPAMIHVGDDSYRTDELDKARFYELLATLPDLPRTEALSVDICREAFARLTVDGSTLLCILISSQISRTFTNAVEAAKDFGARIVIYDSRGFSLWEGFLAMYAAQLVSRGMHDAGVIVRHLDQIRQRSKLFLLPDTLTYLHKGGRVNLAQYMLGSLLDAKPLLTLDNGKIVPAGQVRGQARARAELKQRMREAMHGVDNIWLGVVHTNAPDLGRELADGLKGLIHPAYTLVTDAGPPIAAHAGPDGVGAVACPIPVL